MMSHMARPVKSEQTPRRLAGGWGNALATIPCAAHLLRRHQADIDALVSAGLVNIESIRGWRYVRLDAVEAALAGYGPGDVR